MNALMKVFIELVGLFVDDGWLALAIIGVVEVTALVAALAPHGPVAAGIVLLVGCPGVLFSNVMRTRHRGSV
jgi:predicted Na+-dependent transporter